MKIHGVSALRIAGHLLLALGVSGLLLALLIQMALSGAAAQVFPRLLTLLRSASIYLVAAYVVLSLMRTVLQTLRYQLVLRSSDPAIPGFWHIFLVTTSRNMFIDMLPSRLGELSYVAMLNRGHKVPVSSGLSSLAIAFLFDLAALALLIALLAGYQIVRLELQWWLVVTALLVLFVFLVGLLLLFPGLQEFSSLARRVVARWHWPPGRKLAEKILSFLDALVLSLRHAREAGIAGRLMLYSMGVRITKYLSLYCLFYAVAVPHFPEVDTALHTTLMALISAEAGASMPLPTFMGFGSYEAGGMLAMVALGASQDVSLLIMLSLHLLSQAVDYLLGGTAFIAFMIMTKSKSTAIATTNDKTWRIPWYTLIGLALCAFASFFLLKEVRQFKMRQALIPPTEFGQAITPEQGHGQTLAQMLRGRTGFMVWSSNRGGIHDLWIRTLPEGTEQRLTTHPHTEYYPRISPDGTQIVFTRSQEEWNSHRNFWGWNVVLLDLTSGKERQLARDGNVPVWSADGKKIYFQRDGRQIVELDLASGQEQLVLESGNNIKLPRDTWLGLPNVSPDGEMVALTLSGALRTTAVISRSSGSVRFAGNGCQLAWAPDGSYLFKVDHGGKQQNALYRLDQGSLAAEQWFDAPGEFSHEYFPRVINTGDLLVYGASSGDHEHDKADYEIFLWQIGQPAEHAVRLTFHSGNDNWPDVYLYPTQP
jgi:uncharacterized protein (TIRG00374 family)